MLEVGSKKLAWLSAEWFKLETLLGFEWEYPLLLYLILLIPLIFILRLLVAFNRRQRLEVALFDTNSAWDPSSLLRFIPPTLLFLALVFMCISLARPQRTNERREQWTEGIDIMLVMDISESMNLEDLRPNRLEAAKNTAQSFVNGRFQDRIGMVVFSGEAFSLSPLTTDYNLLTTYIQEINFGMVQADGTAIGSGIAVATNRMRESAAKSKVMILLSDGENNAGNIDPIMAARLAYAHDIKIHSIAIGKEGQIFYGHDPFGRPVYHENNLDETTLREIARIGQGEFFRVSDNQALQEVFAQIDQMEKSEIKETRYKDTIDFYDVYLSWAIVMFLGWIFVKGTFISNLLRD
ncbi:Mg-chelatase subunit ChlD [Flammeovirgaceae bacterium 311]|nr:Mg-chelatase subunit ChlD [Flammeovirgaceae bacterium 311]